MTGKRIIYLVTQSKYGGAQRYILSLAEYTRQTNTVLIVVGCPDEQDQAFFQSAKAKNIDVKLLSHLQREIDPWTNLQSIVQIYQLVSQFKPDVLHINSSMAGFTGSIATDIYNVFHKRNRVKIIYTAHGFVFNEPLPLLQKKFYLWLEKFSAHFKDVIISVSDFDKISAVRAGVAADKKIITIHNGINSSDYSFRDKNSAREKLKLPVDKIIVGTIASHYPTKGLPYLIEAATLFSDVPDVYFVIIGDGPEKPQLETMIREKGLTDRVLLLGAIPQAASYLPAFDIFVLASVKEGLSYTLLEAGLAQLPVVCTDAGGNGEIITDKVTGRIVPLADPEALANAIKETLGNAPEAQKWATALQAHVVANFSGQKMLERTMAVYDR